MQNWGLKTKLYALLGVALAVAFMIGLTGFIFVQKIDDINMKVVRAELFRGDMINMQMAHLKWRLELGKFQRDEKMVKLDIEKNPHNCAFGKWYYGDERKVVEAEMPNLIEPMIEIEKLHNEFHDSATVIENFLQQGKRTEALLFFSTEVTTRLANAVAKFEQLKAISDHYVKEFDDDASFALTESKIIMSVIFLIDLIGLLIIGSLFARNINLSLQNVASTLKNSGKQIQDVSGELNKVASEISSGSSEQASSVEQTSSSLEELSGMVENNVSHAQNSGMLIHDLENVCQEGTKAMDSLQVAMTGINEGIAKIEALVKAISEIGEKTAIMDDIVFQTKLLSFNASVEAERAGEAGRGFSIVAQEVGNLAKMSGQAAREISQIVKDSLTKAEAVNKDNKERVEQGSHHVQEMNQRLQQMQIPLVTIVKNSQQVLQASKDQSAGIKQIATVMDQLSQTSQQNAATAEETASTSEELNQQIAMLEGAIAELEQVIHGR